MSSWSHFFLQHALCDRHRSGHLFGVPLRGHPALRRKNQCASGHSRHSGIRSDECMRAVRIAAHRCQRGGVHPLTRWQLGNGAKTCRLWKLKTLWGYHQYSAAQSQRHWFHSYLLSTGKLESAQSWRLRAGEFSLFGVWAVQFCCPSVHCIARQPDLRKLILAGMLWRAFIHMQFLQSHDDDDEFTWIASASSVSFQIHTNNTSNNTDFVYKSPCVSNICYPILVTRNSLCVFVCIHELLYIEFKRYTRTIKFNSRPKLDSIQLLNSVFSTQCGNWLYDYV